MKNADELNVGYVLSLRKRGNGMLYVDKIIVPRPEDILTKLDEFEDDSWYDLFYIQKYVSTLNIPLGEKYKYCWPHDYREAYISQAQIPKEKTKEDLQNELDAVKSRIEMEYHEKLHPKHHIEDYWDYIGRVRKKMAEDIQTAQENKKKEIRNDYINEVRRYIYAQCLDSIMPSIKKDALIYSNDEMGWYRPNYTITENVLVSVRTNFCYGRSAYFHVNLNYKGINILPYTDIITYFWSNMMDNVRYTIDYYPSRSNWAEALSFVEEVSNLIKTNSERFEKEWIIDKVEKMMEGLKTINEDITKYYEKQKEAKKKDDEEKNRARAENRETRQIVRYRFIDDLTVKRHKIYEHETLLTIQVDKLSAALSLLDDLTSIQNIYAPVLKHIETIIQYNEKLVPAIAQCRNGIQERLTLLKKQLQVFQEQRTNTENEMQSIKIRVDKQLEENNVEYQQWSLNNANKQNMLMRECEKDDDYRKIQKLLSSLIEKINSIQSEIRDRESFDKHLAERNEYIEKKLNERKSSN